MSRELGARTLLKKVLIVGPGISITTEIKRLCEREGCLLIGDGTRCVTEQEIREQLSGRFDSRTEFFINGHGSTFMGMLGINILDSLNSSTKKIFSMLSSLAPGVLLRINVNACYAGASARDVDVLPVGSSVVAFGSEDALTWHNINQRIIKKELERRSSESVFFDIADALKYGASQTLTFGIRLTDGTTRKFSIRPPIHALLSLEAAEEYFQYQCHTVYEELRKLNREHLLPKSLALPPPTFRVRITEEELRQLRREWFQFGFGSYNRTYKEGQMRPFFEEDKVFGGEALVASAQEGKIGAIKYLVKEGVYINQVDSNGWTALTVAVANGHVEAVQELVRLGADINQPDGNGWTALTRAASSGHVEVVRGLVELGADINKPNGNGWTALTNAVFNRNIGAVRELVRLGANINKPDGNGGTALTEAAASRNVGAVRELVRLGANIDQQSNGRTSLTRAVQQGNVEVAKELVKLGAKINLVNKDGEVPVIVAAKSQEWEIMERWIDLGALTEAVKGGKVDVVREATKFDMSVVNRPDKNGWTLLAKVAEEGKLGVVKELLELGADPTQRDRLGYVASHYVIRNKPELTSTLILAESLHNSISSKIRKGWIRESENEKLIRTAIASEVLGEVFKQFDAEMLQSRHSEVVECVMQEVSGNEELTKLIEDWKGLSTEELKKAIQNKPLVPDVEDMVRRSKEEVTRAASTQEAPWLGGVLKGTGSVAATPVRGAQGERGRGGTGVSRD